MYMVLPDLQRYVWCRAVMAVHICVHAAVEITLAVHKHRPTIMHYLNLQSKLSSHSHFTLLTSLVYSMTVFSFLQLCSTCSTHTLIFCLTGLYWPIPTPC